MQTYGHFVRMLLGDLLNVSFSAICEEGGRGERGGREGEEKRNRGRVRRKGVEGEREERERVREGGNILFILRVVD